MRQTWLQLLRYQVLAVYEKEILCIIELFPIK